MRALARLASIRIRWAAGSLLLGALVSCTGEIGEDIEGDTPSGPGEPGGGRGGSGPATPGSQPGGVDPALPAPGSAAFTCTAGATPPTRWKRLTADEYRNTLRDLIASFLPAAEVPSVTSAVPLDDLPSD